MRLLTERFQIYTVAQRWRRQYPSGLDGIELKLDKLHMGNATSAEIALIIGNESWVQPQECSECHLRTWNIIEVGEEPDYESNTANLCFGCLRKAAILAGIIKEAK